jgi:integrase
MTTDTTLVGKRVTTDVPGVMSRLKADGSYSYDAIVWIDGRQKWRAFPTKQKAKAAKVKAEADKLRGEAQPLTGVTLHDYLTDWLNRRRDVRPETLAEYVRVTENYTLKFFSDRLKLSDVTPRRLNEFVEWLEDEDKQERLLNERTVRNIIGPLRKGLREAARTGKLRVNPAADLRVAPRAATYHEDDEDTDVRAFEPEQVAAILSMAKDPYELLFRVLAYTGLRISEAVALRWRDIGLGDAPEIRVRRRYRRGRFDFPKTGAGRRDIAIDQDLADALTLHRGLAAEDDLVFPSRNGTPLDADNVRARVLTPLVGEVGASGLSFHAFRHFYASAQIEAGVNPVQLADSLGHANAAVTLGVYAHAFKDGKAPAPNMGLLLKAAAKRARERAKAEAEALEAAA